MKSKFDQKKIYSRFVLSFSMSNYLIYSGGTNLAVSSHQKLFNANEISYVCIVPFLFHGKKFELFKDYWSLIIDGNHSGVYNTLHIIQIIKKIEEDGATLAGIHIHHWKNTDFNLFQKILDTVNGPVYMFIHDYSTVCPNFTLLREGEFCGYGELTKERCHDCEYYLNALNKKNIYEGIWNKLQSRIWFVFPSEVAKDVWLSAYPQYKNMCSVIPHQSPTGLYCGNMGETKTKLNIAYIGSREFYKGWDLFLDLYNKKKEDRSFEWFYFGTDKIKINGIKSIYADNRADPLSMVKALRSNKIDVALLWSLCKETYSYTYFECYSANTFVLTNINSGNVALQVERNRNGIVFDSADSLINFDNEELKRKLDTYKLGKSRGPETLSTNKRILDCISSSCKKEPVLVGYKRYNFIESGLCILEKLNFVIKEWKYALKTFTVSNCDK